MRLLGTVDYLEWHGKLILSGTLESRLQFLQEWDLMDSFWKIGLSRQKVSRTEKKHGDNLEWEPKKFR